MRVEGKSRERILATLSYDRPADVESISYIVGIGKGAVTSQLKKLQKEQKVCRMRGYWLDKEYYPITWLLWPKD